MNHSSQDAQMPMQVRAAATARAGVPRPRQGGGPAAREK